MLAASGQRHAHPHVCRLQVAVKIMQPSEATEEDLARVAAEVQVSQQLRHPHLVRTYTHAVIRCGASDGCCCSCCACLPACGRTTPVPCCTCCRAAKSAESCTAAHWVLSAMSCWIQYAHDRRT
jgi:hypothetical protein